MVACIPCEGRLRVPRIPSGIWATRKGCRHRKGSKVEVRVTRWLLFATASFVLAAIFFALAAFGTSAIPGFTVVAQAAATSANASPPPATLAPPTRYDQADPAISYSGTWATQEVRRLRPQLRPRQRRRRLRQHRLQRHAARLDRHAELHGRGGRRVPRRRLRQDRRPARQGRRLSEHRVVHGHPRRRRAHGEDRPERRAAPPART